jgi:hypothetical protein
MNEGLRLGMFVGGVVMAAVPVAVGIGFGVFLFREFKKERLLREAPPE